MTPKQMSRLGVFQIQEAILSVLEELEGIALETISTVLGIPDYLSEETIWERYPIVMGVLAKLQSEGYVEISDNCWKIV